MAADLRRMLHLAVQNTLPARDSLLSFHKAIALINAYAAEISVSADMRQKILFLLSANEFAAVLRRFCEWTPPISYNEHTSQGPCPRNYAALHLKFQQRLGFLFLQTALLSSKNALRLDSSVATALLEKHIRICVPSPICSNFRSQRPAGKILKASILETESTPQGMPSLNWRARLSDTLSRDATYQHELLVQLVGEVCLDLETRCESAEQPFRNEQARSQQLELRLEDSERRAAALEAEVEEFRQVTNGLTSEKRRLTEQHDEANRRSNSLLADFECLQKAAVQTEDKAARIEKASLEAARQKDLACLAIIAGREEKCNKLSLEVETLQVQNTGLAKEIAGYGERESNQAALITSLKDSLAHWERKLEASEAQAEARSAEIEKLQLSRAELVSENSLLKRKV